MSRRDVRFVVDAETGKAVRGFLRMLDAQSKNETGFRRQIAAATDFDRKMSSGDKALKGYNSSLRSLSSNALKLGAALGGPIAAATSLTTAVGLLNEYWQGWKRVGEEMASSNVALEKHMRSLFSLGDNNKNIPGLRREVLDRSVAAGVDPAKVKQGMFLAQSTLGSEDTPALRATVDSGILAEMKGGDLVTQMGAVSKVFSIHPELAATDETAKRTAAQLSLTGDISSASDAEIAKHAPRVFSAAVGRGISTEDALGLLAVGTGKEGTVETAAVSSRNFINRLGRFEENFGVELSGSLADRIDQMNVAIENFQGKGIDQGEINKLEELFDTPITGDTSSMIDQVKTAIDAQATKPMSQRDVHRYEEALDVQLSGDQAAMREQMKEAVERKFTARATPADVDKLIEKTFEQETFGYAKAILRVPDDIRKASQEIANVRPDFLEQKVRARRTDRQSAETDLLGQARQLQENAPLEHGFDAHRRRQQMMQEAAKISIKLASPEIEDSVLNTSAIEAAALGESSSKVRVGLRTLEKQIRRAGDTEQADSLRLMFGETFGIKVPSKSAGGEIRSEYSNGVVADLFRDLNARRGEHSLDPLSVDEFLEEINKPEQRDSIAEVIGEKSKVEQATAYFAEQPETQQQKVREYLITGEMPSKTGFVNAMQGQTALTGGDRPAYHILNQLREMGVDPGQLVSGQAGEENAERVEELLAELVPNQGEGPRAAAGPNQHLDLNRAATDDEMQPSSLMVPSRFWWNRPNPLLDESRDDQSDLQRELQPVGTASDQSAALAKALVDLTGAMQSMQRGAVEAAADNAMAAHDMREAATQISRSANQRQTDSAARPAAPAALEY